jgi:hypothetical protein
MPISFEEASENLENALDMRGYISVFGLGVCSVIMFIMVRMHVYRNPLMSLVFYMNILQFVYDLSLLRWCGSEEGKEDISYFKCRAVTVGLLHFAAMSICTCTNLISCLVAFVITKKRAVQASQTVLLLLMIIPSIVLGVYEGITFYDFHKDRNNGGYRVEYRGLLEVFDVIQLLSAIINFTAGAFIIFQLRAIKQLNSCNPCAVLCCMSSRGVPRAGAGAGRTPSARGVSNRRSVSGSVMKVTRNSISAPKSGNSRGPESKAPLPLFLLAQRLVWYPIIATVSLFASMWYHMSQNSGIDSYPETAEINPKYKLQTVQLYFVAAALPLAGIAYASVFLFVHPGAWVEFKFYAWYVWMYVRHLSKIPPELLAEKEKEHGSDKGAAKGPRLVNRKQIPAEKNSEESSANGKAKPTLRASNSLPSVLSPSFDVDDDTNKDNRHFSGETAPHDEHRYDSENHDYAYGDEVEEEWDFDDVEDLETYIAAAATTSVEAPAESTGIELSEIGDAAKNPMQTEIDPDLRGNKISVSPFRESSAEHSNL